MCLNVGLCTWVNARGGQKKVLKPMELELEGSCELSDKGAVTEMRSSARVVHPLPCWAISSVPVFWFLDSLKAR